MNIRRLAKILLDHCVFIYFIYLFIFVHVARPAVSGGIRKDPGPVVQNI